MSKLKESWKAFGKKVEFLDSGPGRIAAMVLAAFMILYGLYPFVVGGENESGYEAPSYMIDE